MNVTRVWDRIPLVGASQTLIRNISVEIYKFYVTFYGECFKIVLFGGPVNGIWSHVPRDFKNVPGNIKRFPNQPQKRIREMCCICDRTNRLRGLESFLIALCISLVYLFRFAFSWLFSITMQFFKVTVAMWTLINDNGEVHH